jgi:hypothetical protein
MVVSEYFSFIGILLSGVEGWIIGLFVYLGPAVV